MKKFYVYKGSALLGSEPLGTSNRDLFELKTVRGAINRAKHYFGAQASFQVYTYTNFYDSKTFRQVYSQF